MRQNHCQKMIICLCKNQIKEIPLPLSVRMITYDKMRNILSDSSKFSEICIVKEKHLDFLINIEKQVTDLLKQLNDSQVISDTEYKKLKPRSSRFGIRSL